MKGATVCPCSRASPLCIMTGFLLDSSVASIAYPPCSLPDSTCPSFPVKSLVSYAGTGFAVQLRAISKCVTSFLIPYNAEPYEIFYCHLEIFIQTNRLPSSNPTTFLHHNGYLRLPSEQDCHCDRILQRTWASYRSPLCCSRDSPDHMRGLETWLTCRRCRRRARSSNS